MPAINPRNLFDKLNPACRRALEGAAGLSCRELVDEEMAVASDWAKTKAGDITSIASKLASGRTVGQSMRDILVSSIQTTTCEKPRQTKGTSGRLPQSSYCKPNIQGPSNFAHPE